jgi:hypothetical protein
MLDEEELRRERENEEKILAQSNQESPIWMLAYPVDVAIGWIENMCAPINVQEMEFDKPNQFTAKQTKHPVQNA